MKLHLHEWGDPNGDLLVCLHGLSGHGGRFRRLAERLPGRRLIAPDLRGHGRSGREPPWDTRTHVEDVLQTVDQLGTAGADWLGFSFGGRILAELAPVAAELVERACLLDPALSVPPGLAGERAEAELGGETYDSPEQAVEAELSSGLLYSTPRELLEEEMEDNLVKRPDGRFEYRYSRAMAVTAWSEMAREPPRVAAVPTLIVTGKRSWIPVDTARYPGAVLVSVPGGHSVLWDSLDETAAAVRVFLG